jgi:hypothetical protein
MDSHRRREPIARLVSTAAVFLACVISSGQSRPSEAGTPTFHVHGTVRITYRGSPLPGTKVTFKGTKIATALYTDRAGVYQGNLPFGTYTMTANPPDPGVPSYERPLFRVASSANITIDVLIPSEVMVGCEVGVRPGKQEVDPDDYVNACGGSASFPVPSEDGVPFEILIRFGRREPAANGYVYSAAWKLAKEPSYIYKSGSTSPSELGTQVFVAYNLFTLLADHVTYDAQKQILRANGHCTVESPDGTTKRADSVTFKFENGEAVSVP